MSEKLKDFSFLGSLEFYCHATGLNMAQYNGFLHCVETQARSSLPLSFFLKGLFNNGYGRGVTELKIVDELCLKIESEHG